MAEQQSPTEYTQSRISGVTPRRSELPGYQQRAARTGRSTGGESVTGSRVITDKNKKITTYSSGKVVVTDLSTGSTKEYMSKAGITPGDVSIPDEGIKSFSEQRQEQQIIESKKVAEQQATERERQLGTRLTNQQIAEKQQQQLKQRERQISAITGKSIRGDVTTYETYQPAKDYEVKGGYVSPSRQESVQADKIYVAPYKPFYEGQVSKPSQIDYKRTYKEYVSPFIKPKKTSPEQRQDAIIKAKKEFSPRGFGLKLTEQSSLFKTKEAVVYEFIASTRESRTKQYEKFEIGVRQKTDTDTMPPLERFSQSVLLGAGKSIYVNPEQIPISYTLGGMVGYTIPILKSTVVATGVSKTVPASIGKSISVGFKYALPTAVGASYTAKGLGYDVSLKGITYTKPKDYAQSFGSVIGKDLPKIISFGAGYRAGEVKVSKPEIRATKEKTSIVQTKQVGEKPIKFIGRSEVTQEIYPRGTLSKIEGEKAIVTYRGDITGASIKGKGETFDIQGATIRQTGYKLIKRGKSQPKLIKPSSDISTIQSFGRTKETEMGLIRFSRSKININERPVSEITYLSKGVRKGKTIKSKGIEFEVPLGKGFPSTLTPSELERGKILSYSATIAKETKRISSPENTWESLYQSQRSESLSESEADKIYKQFMNTPRIFKTKTDLGTLTKNSINNNINLGVSSSSKTTFVSQQAIPTQTSFKSATEKLSQKQFTNTKTTKQIMRDSLKLSPLVVPKQTSIPKSTNRLQIKPITQSKINLDFKQKVEPRSILKVQPRSQLRTEPISSLSLKQLQKLDLKTKTTNLQKVVPIGYTSTFASIGTIYKPTNHLPPPTMFGMLSKPEKELKTFDVFLKRRGEFGLVGRGLTKGRALQLGVQSAEVGLGATFKLAATGKTTTQRDISFKPGKEFRSFKIVKGRRVETPLQFIQRREFRLGTVGEKREIKLARIR